MEYKISKDYLNLLFKAKARTIVGRVLRRIETISNVEPLKDSIKDLIPEEMRDLLTTIDAYHNGKIFSLTHKDSTQK